MVELWGAFVGHAGAVHERMGRRVGVLEERHGALGTELEKVVAEIGRADRGDERGAKGSVVEANRGVHIGGHEREMVDPLPARSSVLASDMFRGAHDRAPAASAVAADTDSPTSAMVSGSG